MKNLKLRLAAPALAVALGLGLAAAPALAYFTASDEANGGMVIKWPDTDITDDFDKGKKTAVIYNDEDSVPMYIRAKFFIPNNITASSIAGEGWVEGANGWYEYRDGDTWTIVMPGEKTTELIAEIKFPFEASDVEGSPTSSTGDEGGETGGTSITKIEANGTEYNVVVIYEAVPVTYEADGETPAAPVWNS